MKPITVWLRYVDGDYQHNHIEDGHSIAAAPTPMCDEQRRNWNGQKWTSRHGWLDADCRVVCMKPAAQ